MPRRGAANGAGMTDEAAARKRAPATKRPAEPGPITPTQPKNAKKRGRLQLDKEAAAGVGGPAAGLRSRAKRGRAITGQEGREESAADNGQRRSLRLKPAPPELLKNGVPYQGSSEKSKERRSP